MSWLPAEIAHVGKYKTSLLKQTYLYFHLSFFGVFFDGARLLAPYNSSIVNMAAPLQLK